MAKLYFYYSSMNAGKSTMLLQSDYNYRELGMRTMLFTPKAYDRDGKGKVASRIGIQAQAYAFEPEENLLDLVREHHLQDSLHCVLVDEAQSLSRDQVYQLSEIVDQLNIPVLAYGLRTDFRGELFEGSAHLLAWADNLNEIKTVCHCGKKAIMTIRMDESGNPVQEGAQVEIGGNERYVSMCRRHFKETRRG